MADKETTSFMRELAALPMTVSLGGKPYPVAMLSPADLALAQQYVVDQRCKRYMASATINEFLNPVHAEVLSKLHAAPILIENLVTDSDGCLRLCYMALIKGGVWAGTQEELSDELDHHRIRDFSRTLFIASGLLVKPEPGDIPSDPSEPTPDTKP